MIRLTTLRKERKVISEFHRLLRSGKDYTTSYMYAEAGKTCFLSRKHAGNIVRKYYNSLISKKMITFMNRLNGMIHEEKVSLFSKKFSVCIREARLIIRYIPHQG